ncbi:hypothetical protein [Kitasatospora sp. NPDC096204]|uniref:hypothetical protein n=1 Tax=Kitasatospora sp. NPDC096204 TaxID=3364094 RepID=UPI003802BA93
MELGWDTGTTPWLRRAQAEQQPSGQKKVQCLFCGAQTAILSTGDLDGDQGRVEVYCDNGRCDAREVIMLVRRDGAHARWRADVRTLEAIDDGRLNVDEALPQSEGFKTYSYMELVEMEPDDAGLVARRSAQPRD